MKVVALGEVMMRISTPIGEHLNNVDYLNIYFGGGEYNTLVNLAGLGHDTQIVTSLPDNQLTDRILKEARGYGVGYDFVNIKEARLGTYYSILGNDAIATQVIYDRAGSAFEKSHTSDFKPQEFLSGADLFHVSGITPALNSKLEVLTLESIKEAKKLGIKVSYDSNYRAKLWSPEKAGEFLKLVLPLVDYVFLGILDMKYLLKMEVDSLEEGYKILKDKYPNLKYMASTNREVVSSTLHKMQVNVFDEKLYQTDINDITVVDRIGGGDVFTGGILDGILQGKETPDIANFALADLKVKHSYKGDNCYVNRDMIDGIVNGNSLKITR